MTIGLVFPETALFHIKAGQSQGFMVGEDLPVQARFYFLPSPSNLGRASARSALRGTHFISVRIEIRRNLWTPLLRRADGGARTSAAPLLTGRTIARGVQRWSVNHGWMPGCESYCQM